MKKIVVFLSLMLSLASFALSAQNIAVKGNVKDTDGQPVPAAAVQVKGTTQGAITDADGNYSISAPKGAVLVYSSIGYKSVEVTVADQAKIDIVLESDSELLDEVVVTALGITKSQKAIGYSATTVKGDEISAERTTNPISSLAGKVAGMQISSSSTTAGSPQSVIIRGISSISGNNQPMYVIDGVPMQSVNVNNTTSGTATVGAGIGSVNADDIESITVLKGAAASALYGSRASGGVIVVNTKSGQKGRTQVTVNAGVQFATVGVLPEFQNDFGTGWNGGWTRDENGSWGPAFNGKPRVYGPVVDNSQMMKDFKAMPNNIRDFYDTGVQWNTSVALEGGTDKTNFYASYSHTSDDGILPTSKDKYTKNTLAFRGSHQAYKWLKASASMNYTTQKTSQVGQSSMQNSMIEGLYQAGRDISFIDAADLTNKFNTPTGWFTPYSVVNPYWIIDNAYNVTDMKKLFGKAQLDITPIRQLTFTYRFGFDYTDFDRKVTEVQIAVPSYLDNSALNQDGNITASYGRYHEFNHDFLAKWSDKYINDKLDVNIVAGATINDRGSTSMGASVIGLTFDTGFWDLSNTPNNPSVSESQSLRRYIGVFADAQLGWDDQVYLDVTARNDWSSTLPQANNSYFYPGATLSWIFTNTFKNTGVLSFGKLRAAIGRTGNDPSAYLTNPVYVQGYSTAIYSAATEIQFPFAGYNGYMKQASLASANLQPEMTTEFEFGADVRFFNDRIGLDATYYNRLSDMQIFSLPVDPATGYTSMTMNFGKVRNQGVELLLSTTPVRTKDIKWDLDFTWSKNFNKVESLPEGLDGGKSLITNDGWGDVYMYAEVGKPIGQLYATLPQYTEDGKIIVNAEGLPIQGSDREWTGYDVQNLWTGGINTSFTWKNLSIAATFDFHYGGKMYSRTKSLLWFTGNSIETTYNNRDAFVIPNSVVSDGNGGYVENTTPITMTSGNFQYYYDGNYSYPLEGSACCLIDRSYAKLRNLTISYNLPQKWMDRIHMKGICLSAVGNNLFTWTPASNCYIDPDQGYTTDLKGMLGEYYCTVPCRYFGFNVKVTF